VPAAAQTFDVKQLDVQKGSLELGLDNTVQPGLPRNVDANRSAHDQGLDYGVTDRWRLSAVLKFENPGNEDLLLAKPAVENIFVFTAVPQQYGGGLVGSRLSKRRPSVETTSKASRLTMGGR
jgi:hypothetical protein